MYNLLFALIGGILIYNLIMLFFAKRNKRLNTLTNRLESVSKLESVEKIQNDNVNKSFTKRVITPIINKIIGVIANLLPTKKDKKGSKLASDLKSAGIWISPKEYTSKSIVIILLFTLGGGIVGLIFKFNLMYIILLALFFALVGYVFRRFSLQSKITRRKDEIQNQLPGVLDLLSISVTAGSGFDQALGHVVEKDRGALIEELEIARREISLGKTRKESLADLAERCNVEELKTFVGAVNQSDELGISLKNVIQLDYLINKK